MAKVYQALAVALQAQRNCEERGNEHWQGVWGERIAVIMRDAPSGSGIDSGTKLDDCSNCKRLVFQTAFHHMGEHGMYTRWTDHAVKVTPSFTGFDLVITGRDHNEIKDYLADVFHHWLDSEAPAQEA